jgi:hypothetical protein
MRIGRINNAAMKKLTFSLLLFMGTGLLAQTNTTLIKAGSGFANLHFKNADAGYQGRAIWYGGLAEQIQISSQFFFQPELLYSLRGYHQPPTGPSTGGNVGFSYLSLPLLAVYKPIKKLSFLVGPEPGYMLFARSHVNGSSYSITDYVNYRFNVDADAGIDYDLTSSLIIETRFLIGLSALDRVMLTDNNGSNLGIAKDGYHRVVQIGLAYRL